MSWAHVKSAIESELQGLDKLVLIMLANHVNDQDGNPKRGLAWPSVTTLVTEAGISRATVNRVLNRLEAGGYLAREHHGTRSTHYRLSVSEGDTNARARKVNVSQGDTNAIVSQRETGVSHSETPSVSERDINLLENPLRTEEERGSLQGGPLSFVDRSGIDQPDPTPAPRMTARPSGNGVKSADAENEEKRWRLYQKHIAELEAAGVPTDGMDHNQSAIAVTDLRLQDKKNGRTTSAALTSGTANGAPCQGQ